ncbi:hypothetical protein [Brevundimonas sp.]|uniref:hypothetical protein n=1 Tax=Brevundimonas sp. TaxID=1871086 RepID=UPI0040343AA8
MTDQPETAAEALKRVLAAKKAGSAGAGKAAFKPGQHPEKVAAARSTAMAKPAFRKASKRG